MSPERDDADADADADDDKLDTSAASPLNMTGGFSQDQSPVSQDASDVMRNDDALDDNSALTGSFYGD
jgi:hypothetical protein